MRLLNVHTRKLETFVASPPEYAILSHTWEDEEVLYEDICRPRHELRLMKGYKKISYSCIQATIDGLQYVWIDTCCIDKSSSAELSEAINSMFDWYASSEVCYAYLSDFELPEGREDDLSGLHPCRWFRRGWTLQELIAPCRVLFFDAFWTYIGDKGTSKSGYTKDWHQPTRNLSQHLSSITRIPQSVLNRRYPQELDPVKSALNDCSVSQRMNWTANRGTSRPEDGAYCLMGLFSVNMPLLYGEGGCKAFGRLQEEILRVSRDQSIFAIYDESLFATDASDFVHKDQSIELVELPAARHPDGHAPVSYMESHANATTTDMFICPLQKCPDYTKEEHRLPIVPTDLYLGILNCALLSDLRKRPVIVLEKLRVEEQVYQKFKGLVLVIGASMNMISVQEMHGVLDFYQRMSYDLCEARMERISISRKYLPLRKREFQASQILSLQIHLSEKCIFLHYWPRQRSQPQYRHGVVHVNRPSRPYGHNEKRLGVLGAVVIELPDGQAELLLWGSKPNAKPSDDAPQEKVIGCQRLSISAELRASYQLWLTDPGYTLNDPIEEHIRANSTPLSLAGWQKHHHSAPGITWIESKQILGHTYGDLHICSESYPGQREPESAKQLETSDVGMIAGL